eukprot:SAG22_NODE_2217_length_2823_cov_1.554495_4_plen_34_part_01
MAHWFAAALYRQPGFHNLPSHPTSPSHYPQGTAS